MYHISICNGLLTCQLILTDVIPINFTVTLPGGDGGGRDRVTNSFASLKFPTPIPFSALTWNQYNMLGWRFVNNIIGEVELTVN